MNTLVEKMSANSEKMAKFDKIIDKYSSIIQETRRVNFFPQIPFKILAINFFIIIIIIIIIIIFFFFFFFFFFSWKLGYKNKASI